MGELTLAKKLIDKFITEVVLIDQRPFKDVYQVKTIHSGLGDSILFSCRFKNKIHNTFILSIHIKYKDPNPLIRASIHLLCPWRRFSRTIFNSKVNLSYPENLKGLSEDPIIHNYFKLNRKIPYDMMLKTFNKHVETKLVEFINQIEERKFVW